MNVTLALPSTLVAADCSMAPVEREESIARGHRHCNAGVAALALGEHFDDTMLRHVREDTDSNNVCFQQPLQRMARDHREGRVNIELDAAGAVAALHCG